MADDEGDLHDVDVVFSKRLFGEHDFVDLVEQKPCVYLGEQLKCAIIARCPDGIQFSRWKKRIVHLSAYGMFGVIHKIPPRTQIDASDRSPKKESTRRANYITCPVVMTSLESGSSAEKLKKLAEPYFTDSRAYVFPVQACLDSLPGDSDDVSLHVTMWLATPQHVSLEREYKTDFQLPGISRLVGRQKTIQQRTVTKELKVLKPPTMKMKLITAGGKHLILIQLTNSSCGPVYLYSCDILQNAGPEMEEFSPLREEVSLASKHWGQLVTLMSSESVQYPVRLSSLETLSLVFSLNLGSLQTRAMETDLTFRAHVRWSHSAEEKPILTLFSLPKIRVRCPPFTVTVSCTDDVQVGKSFKVIYNVVNKLQDFLSMKLYWNIDHQWNLVKDRDDDDPLKKRIQEFKEAVVCHDPDVYMGSCPRGTSVPVSVSFQLLRPGLFEFSELMKVNLRYALLDSQSTLKQESPVTPGSSDTGSTLSADDQLAAAEELWRDRSGSTSSLHTPTSVSAQDRRKTFATKSYSFGDLGPTLSTDSDECNRIRFKCIKRSTAVPPPRPPPPRLLSQVERDVTNPSNFLKKPFQIYIP